MSVILGLAVGLLAMLIVAWRWPKPILAATLVLLLIHQYLMRVAENLLGFNTPSLIALSLWKELAMGALLLAVVVKALQGRRGFHFAFKKADLLLLLWIGIALVHAAFSPDRVAALAAFRDYFQPVLFFVLARLVLFSVGDLRRLLFSWQALGAVIAGLAIWQGLTWQPDDFVAWGYGRVSGQLGIPYRHVLDRWIIRPPVTLTGPNELAVHMILLSLFALLLLASSSWGRRLIHGGFAALGLGALLVTTSRSGLGGMVLALGTLVTRTVSRRVNYRRLRKRWWLALSLVLLVVLVLGAVTQLPSVQGSVSRVTGRLLDDYHIQDTLGAIQFLIRNPAGVGMGQVGPRQGFGIPTEFAAHVEGSLFQIAMEMGIWGLAVFLGFVGLTLWQVWRNWDAVEHPVLRAVCGTAFAGWIGALVAFTFLPMMQPLSLMAWLWFFLGSGVATQPLKTGQEARMAISTAGQPR